MCLCLHLRAWREGPKLASLVSCSTGDKCVLNFKPCGMFGKELHKVEGYIQDKRYICPFASAFLDFSICLLICSSSLPSKKKHCIIYGKWTECLWSVDPQVYEAHKKLEKKGDKMLKNVRKSLRVFPCRIETGFLSCFLSCWHQTQMQPFWLFVVMQTVKL